MIFLVKKKFKEKVCWYILYGVYIILLVRFWFDLIKIKGNIDEIEMYIL